MKQTTIVFTDGTAQTFKQELKVEWEDDKWIRYRQETNEYTQKMKINKNEIRTIFDIEYHTKKEEK